MPVQHLTAEEWREFAGSAAALRPERAADLAGHLAGGCEVCEAVLAQASPADALDGRVDAILTGLAKNPALGDDVEFARIMRQVRRPRGLRIASALGAVAAVAMVAVIAGVWRPRPPAWTGEKGSAGIAEVDVSFAVAVRAAGAETRVEKGVPGRSYASDRDVLIRYRVPEAGWVSLVRLGPDGSSEVVLDPERVEPGEHDVGVGGQPAGYPLARLTGKQRFVVVWSRLPVRTEELARLAAEARSSEQTGFAQFDVEVVPAK